MDIPPYSTVSVPGPVSNATQEGEEAFGTLPSNPYANEAAPDTEAPVLALVEETTAETLQHTVRQGETLTEIAVRYNLPMGQIIEANPQLPTDLRLLRTGTVLSIPIGEGHGVMPDSVNWEQGDTLRQLAREHGLPASTLWTANRHDLIGGGKLEHGQVVWIPAPHPDTSSPAEPVAETPASDVETQVEAQVEAQVGVVEPEGTLVAGDSQALIEESPATTPEEGLATAEDSPQEPFLPISGSVSASEHYSESASATAVRGDIKFPLDARTYIKASLTDVVKVPEAGTPSSVTRLGVELGTNLYKSDALSVDASASATVWSTLNLESGAPGSPEAGYVSSILLPVVDLSSRYDLGNGVNVHGRAGTWFVAGLDIPAKTAAPYAALGIGISAGPLNVSADVRAQTELKANAPNPAYVLGSFDATGKITAGLSARVHVDRTFIGGTTGASIDFPQGEPGETKLTLGLAQTW